MEVLHKEAKRGHRGTGTGTGAKYYSHRDRS